MTSILHDRKERVVTRVFGYGQGKGSRQFLNEEARPDQRKGGDLVKKMQLHHIIIVDNRSLLHTSLDTVVHPRS